MARLCEFPGPKSLAGFGAAPQAGFRAAALTSPNPLHVSRSLQMCFSPLSPKAVYGGESAKLLRAPRKREICKG